MTKTPDNPGGGGGNEPPREDSSRDENKLIAERRAKLAAWREQARAANAPAFPNDYRRDVLATLLAGEYGDKPAEWFEQNVYEGIVIEAVVGTMAAFIATLGNLLYLLSVRDRR